MPFFFPFLVISCEFEPTDEYKIDLEPKSFGNINIDLLSQPDTFLLLWNTEFTYDIELNTEQIVYNTTIMLDDSRLRQNNSTNGTFDINPRQRETG